MQERVLVEEVEFPVHALAFEEVREPVAVVRPHLVERDLGQAEPAGPHLIGLDRLAAVLHDAEDVDLEDLRAGGEFEAQRAAAGEAFGFEAAFLAEFPAGGVLDRLPHPDLAPEAVPAPGAEAALLHAEQDVRVGVEHAERELLDHMTAWYQTLAKEKTAVSAVQMGTPSSSLARRSSSRNWSLSHSSNRIHSFRS